jgi:TPR repeat protein
MHCHECGQDISTDKAFCSSCGTKIRQVVHNETTAQTGAPVAAAKNSEASLSLEYGPLKWDNIIVVAITVVLFLALLVNFLGESSDEPSLKNGDYVQSSMVDKSVIEKKIKLLQKKCSNNLADACLNISYVYGIGEEVKQDLVKSAEFAKKSCDNENALGCAYLGYLYERGGGVNKNSCSALHYYEKACDAMNAKGCDGYTSMLNKTNGNCYTKNYKELN